MALSESDPVWKRQSFQVSRRLIRRLGRDNITRLKQVPMFRDVIFDSKSDSSGKHTHTQNSATVIPFPNQNPWGENEYIPLPTIRESIQEDIKHALRVVKDIAPKVAMAAIVLAPVAKVAYEIKNGADIVQGIVSQYQNDRNDANVTGEQLLINNKKELSHIRIGATFSPEIMWPQKSAMDTLKRMHEKEKINDIRLGIMWDRVVDKNGNIDFSYYKPYFDYMIKNHISITLSFGIKTPRWPEEHVPAFVLNSLKEIPPDYSIINLDSELGQKSLAYVGKLFEYLKTNYSKEQLASIKSFQPENEPFQSFGDHGWKMSNDYITALIMEARKTLPNAEIFISSAGFLNIDEAMYFFEELHLKHPEINGLVLSIDDHPNAKFSVNLPLDNKIDPFKPFGNITLDPIAYGQFFGNKFQKAIERAKQLGIRIVIGEAGIEGWGSNGPISAKEFNMLILREERRILVPNTDSVIYVWGLENEKDKQILNVIVALNSQKQEFSPSAFIQEVSPFRQGKEI